MWSLLVVFVASAAVVVAAHTLTTTHNTKSLEIGAF